MSELKLGYCRENFTPDKPVRMNSTKTGETIFNDICINLSSTIKCSLILELYETNLYTVNTLWGTGGP